jgi:hypothetical protein
VKNKKLPRPFGPILSDTLSNLLTGQFKWNPSTGSVNVVGSKATERPQMEKQGNLLAWRDDQERLESWGNQF